MEILLFSVGLLLLLAGIGGKLGFKFGKLKISGTLGGVLIVLAFFLG